MTVPLVSPSDQESSVAGAFDAVASDYDATWTESLIGRLQRRQVWYELGEVFRPGDRIIELGCGTASDAVHLAGIGVRVYATDVSREMLNLAELKIEKERLSGMVTLELRSVEQLRSLRNTDQFDGAFSNFGVFNCLRDLRRTAADLANLLRPGAKLVICFMGRFCLWETAWYLLHGCPRKALRRLLAGKDGVEASVGSGPPFKVFYPSVGELVRAFRGNFSLVSFRSVGLLVPPSYVITHSRAWDRIFGKLAQLDRPLGRWPILRGMGDHRLMIFERKTGDANVGYSSMRSK